MPPTVTWEEIQYDWLGEESAPAAFNQSAFAAEGMPGNGLPQWSSHLKDAPAWFAAVCSDIESDPDQAIWICAVEGQDKDSKWHLAGEQDGNEAPARLFGCAGLADTWRDAEAQRFGTAGQAAEAAESLLRELFSQPSPRYVHALKDWHAAPCADGRIGITDDGEPCCVHAECVSSVPA